MNSNISEQRYLLNKLFPIPFPEDLKKIINEQKLVIDSLLQRVEAVEKKSEEAVEMADAAVTAVEEN